MNSRDYETLSAMLDDEADELELRRLLKSAAEDPEVSAMWERMNLVRALLHDDNFKMSRSAPLVGRGFHTDVAVAIAAVPLPVRASRGSTARQWTRSVAKMAIAASVALAFFLGMQVSVNNSAPGSGSVPVAGQNPMIQPVERKPGSGELPAVQPGCQQ